jgi:hypothetical protein
MQARLSRLLLVSATSSRAAPLHSSSSNLAADILGMAVKQSRVPTLHHNHHLHTGSTLGATHDNGFGEWDKKQKVKIWG